MTYSYVPHDFIICANVTHSCLLYEAFIYVT